MRYCKVSGCGRQATRYGVHCNGHKTQARRHGDAEQVGIKKAEIQHYVGVVRRRIGKNPDSDLWPTLDRRWLLLQDYVRPIRASCFRYEREAAEEVLEIAQHAEPRAVVETALAVFVMYWWGNPRRFRSDRAFWFQLVRRVRALSPLSTEQHYSRAEGRMKRVPRELSPRAIETLADWLGDVVGKAGVKLADMERREADERQEAATKLSGVIAALT